MLFIISIVLVLCLVFFGDKPLKKYPVPFYIAGIILTIAVSVISQTEYVRTMPDFLSEYVIGIFSKGSFAGALWCTVMIAGALPNGSSAIKKIMPIRGELSILASAVTMSHVITYGIQYIKTLSNNISLGRSFTSEFIMTCIVVVLLVLIMLPLAVMSFKKIRKKMNPKTWKKIQRTAYLFYALIYLHIMILYVPQARRGITDKYISIILYSIVFIGYAAMRIRKYIVKKNPDKSLISGVMCGFSALLLIILASILSFGKAPERKTPETEIMTDILTTEANKPEITTIPENTSTVSSESTTEISEETTESTTDTAVTSGKTSKTTKSVIKESDESTEEISDNTETTPAEENPAEENPVPDENIPEQNPEVPEEIPEEVPQEQEYIYNNGTYTATAYGYSGDITVTIIIENDVITDIKVLADGDDPEYYEPAMDYIIPQIKKSMSADVDAYSGATYSSQGIIDAVRQALAQALI
ncbi:MAG: FMN-binding protein [Ruminococcus sp.]|nr:FMN-binding protein [Ruminococcus sp.]